MTESKCKIPISVRVLQVNNYNEKRDGISQDWIIFFNKLNFAPILIPNKIEVDSFSDYQLYNKLYENNELKKWISLK